MQLTDLATLGSPGLLVVVGALIYQLREERKRNDQLTKSLQDMADALLEKVLANAPSNRSRNLHDE